MYIEFATCERNRALSFLKEVYPSKIITDTTDCAAPLLDFVEKDIIRIQDPFMYGPQIQIVPGRKWDEGLRQEITDIAMKFHAITSDGA